MLWEGRGSMCATCVLFVLMPAVKTVFLPTSEEVPC